MASITDISASKFIGSPVVLGVVRGNVPAAATFHQVRLTVKVNSAYEYEFTTPVGSETTYLFDISSALRAVADRHVFIADAFASYPSFSYSATACDDYMLNGQMVTDQNQSSTSQTGLCIGALTDRERLTGERPQTYSRKPKSSPEVCFGGNPHLHAGSTGSAPAVSAVTVLGGLQTLADGTLLYGIDQPADGYELRFVNSLGVHENLFVRCLPETETHINTQHHAISRQETLTQMSRGLTRKTDGYEEWKMSSGPLDRQWLQWWMHEPLMARWAWINVSGQWMPVHIMPEETTKGADRKSAKLFEVEFTLRFDINGNPFA